MRGGWNWLKIVSSRWLFISDVEPSGSATRELVRWISGKQAVRMGSGWNWLRIVLSG
jgi:hypothetical protein